MKAIATRQTSYSPLSDFANILRSQFCKLRSVRSTYWTLVVAVVFNVGLAALEAIILPGHLSARDKATLDTVRVSLGGIHLSQIAFGVLGVLVITSEYGTGMIRATLSAVPQRRLMLAAKAIVFAVTALIVGIFASFAAYFIFQAFLSGNSLRSSIGDPGVLRAVTGGGLYLAVLGLFGLGLGAIIRISAGGSQRSSACSSCLRLSSIYCRSPGSPRSVPTSRWRQAARSSPCITKRAISGPGPGSVCSASTRGHPRTRIYPDQPSRRLSR
ncbi:MAG: hypothetical protein ACR2JC_13970 [Chloroflexota bacterium]